MELLLGIEPLTALLVGVGALILVPVVSAVGNTVGKDSNLAESVSQSARDLTKNALAVGIEAVENAKTAMTQAQESFQDILFEAKLEQLAKKSAAQNGQTAEPREVTIISE